MPTKVLETYAKQSGKTIKEVEEKWEECKKTADTKFKEQDKHYWTYVNACTKKKLGIKPLYHKW